MADTRNYSSSYMTYLMHSTDGSTYTKLCDIKDYPDMGGTPELLETTTLSDAIATNILGIQSLDSMDFTANYEPTVFAQLKALEASTKVTPGYFAVYFGATEGVPDGSMGKFKWQGQLSAYVSGKGVNEVREMTISVSATTVIEYSNT